MSKKRNVVSLSLSGEDDVLPPSKRIKPSGRVQQVSVFESLPTDVHILFSRHLPLDMIAVMRCASKKLRKVYRSPYMKRMTQVQCDAVKCIVKKCNTHPGYTMGTTLDNEEPQDNANRQVENFPTRIYLPQTTTLAPETLSYGTGTGKTLIALKACAELVAQGKRCIVLIQRVHQWNWLQDYNKFKKHFCLPPLQVLDTTMGKTLRKIQERLSNATWLLVAVTAFGGDQIYAPSAHWTAIYQRGWDCCFFDDISHRTAYIRLCRLYAANPKVYAVLMDATRKRQSGTLLNCARNDELGRLPTLTFACNVHKLAYPFSWYEFMPFQKCGIHDSSMPCALRKAKQFVLDKRKTLSHWVVKTLDALVKEANQKQVRILVLTHGQVMARLANRVKHDGLWSILNRTAQKRDDVLSAFQHARAGVLVGTAQTLSRGHNFFPKKIVFVTGYDVVKSYRTILKQVKGRLVRHGSPHRECVLEMHCFYHRLSHDVLKAISSKLNKDHPLKKHINNAPHNSVRNILPNIDVDECSEYRYNFGPKLSNVYYLTLHLGGNMQRVQHYLELYDTMASKEIAAKYTSELDI
jgi:hypothetical protein